MNTKNKKLLLVLLFVAPALFFYGTFNLIGIARTFYYSFMEWRGISAAKTFIGLGNYATLMQDGMVWNALKNNVILVVVSVFIQLPAALLLALLINTKIKGNKLFRTVFFMPMLLSTVATGIMWLLFYDPNFGLLSILARSMGLEVSTAFLQGSTALPAILFVICWQFIPFYMVIIRAGITNIPEELYEASKIDGANTWRSFLSITLPLLAPTLRSAAILQLVGSLKYFDLFYIMMGGSPNASTELLATYMYKKGFSEFQMGYASAIAMFMFAISFVVACVFLYMTKTKEAQA
ncbi:ABC transporter permease subunit [Anaerotalea alkaliphila]|uniref:Sugar ABC transporter permease n=1 Tax=Anaerotalea alkaliphila TaxID=2662126 RepID=A0A7X5KMX1_9FIRM|nr:sugar ABC transporter permease [Anaerotalea alkaliphila]